MVKVFVTVKTERRSDCFGSKVSADANTFRNNSLGIPRLPLQEHVAGFTLGGPIRGESVFFVSYELDQVLDSALIDTLVPVRQNEKFPLPAATDLSRRRFEDTEAGAEIAPFGSSVSTPLKNTSITARVDHQFGTRHSAAMVYQGGRFINLRQFGGGNRLAEALQGKRRNSDAFSFSDTFVLSERAVNQLRFQYSRLAPAFEARGGGSPVVLIALKDSLPAEDPERRSGTLVAGSSTSGGSDRREV